MRAPGHGVRKITAAPTPLAFDPALSSADVDLVELAERAQDRADEGAVFLPFRPSRDGQIGLCALSAEKLEMEVLDKRYSDLISSYLGESEKAIANAFEEAAECAPFSFSTRRIRCCAIAERRVHSWEIPRSMKC